MDINNLIIENIANPHELERMFRKEPEAFKKSLTYALEQNPDWEVLAVWYERLHFKETSNTEKAFLLQKGFLFMGLLAILAGICTRIIFHYVEQQTTAPINLAFGILPFIAAYFVYKNPPKKMVVISLAALFLISGIYLNMLPLNYKTAGLATIRDAV